MSDSKFHASQISNAAKTAEERLIAILKTVDMQSKCYAFKTRVKPWDKLLQKVELKRQEKDKENYNVGSVTDVLGLRVVTLFRQDMVEVVDTLLALISHNLPYNPIPFVKDGLKEALIYTPSVGNDPVISLVKQRVNSYGLIDKNDVNEKASAARYSSIHLVAFIDEPVSDYEGDYRVPIEIQVRTVFEDAWGEIDHKYGYQGRAGKSDHKISHPVLVEKNLLTLKKFVDSCSEYADNVRDLATDSASPARRIRGLDTDELIDENLKEAEIDPLVIDEYMKIRQMRLEAEENDNSKQIYIKAAEGFSQLYSQVKENELIQSEGGKKLFRYYIKMDEALCRLSVGKGETYKAISIYRDLLKEYPAYPVIMFRLGQSYLSVNKFEEARAQLKRCRLNIGRLSGFSEEKRKISLPNQELERIEVGLYKMIGLAYWKEACVLYSQGDTKILKAKQYFAQAYLQTQDGLGVGHLTKDQRLKVINNLLFYAIEMVYLKSFNGSSTEYDDVIKSYVSELGSELDIQECDNENKLDTLMNSYLYLRDVEKAVLVAERLEKISLEASVAGKTLDPEILERVNNLLTDKRDNTIDRES